MIHANISKSNSLPPFNILLFRREKKKRISFIPSVKKTEMETDFFANFPLITLEISVIIIKILTDRVGGIKRRQFYLCI